MKTILVSIALFIFGCSVSGGERDQNDSGLNEAWALFEQSFYEEAIQAFQDLIDSDLDVADANCGKGWSQLALQETDDAVRSFGQSLVHNPTWVNSRAGRAFARREGNLLQEVLADGRASLQEDPNWSFSHNRDVDWADLQILLAQVFFYQQEFDSCLTRCLEVDGAIGLDSSDEATWGGADTYQSALFAELTRLSESVAN